MRPDVAARLRPHGGGRRRRRRPADGRLRVSHERRAGGPLRPAPGPEVGRTARHVAAPARDRARSRPARARTAGCAANAGRFHFVQRYSWEPWHYGYVLNPASSKALARRRDSGGDGEAGSSLPSFVPERLRAGAHAGRTALQRLGDAAGRADPAGVAASTRSRLAGGSARDRAVHAGHRRQLRPARLLRRRGLDRRAGAAHARPAAAVRLRAAGAGRLQRRPAAGRGAAAACRRSPRRPPTSPRSSASWAAPATRPGSAASRSGSCDERRGAPTPTPTPALMPTPSPPVGACGRFPAMSAGKRTRLPAGPPNPRLCSRRDGSTRGMDGRVRGQRGRCGGARRAGVRGASRSTSTASWPTAGCPSVGW